jgi:hypothetical protein
MVGKQKKLNTNISKNTTKQTEPMLVTSWYFDIFRDDSDAAVVNSHLRSVTFKVVFYIDPTMINSLESQSIIADALQFDACLALNLPAYNCSRVQVTSLIPSASIFSSSATSTFSNSSTNAVSNTTFNNMSPANFIDATFIFYGSADSTSTPPLSLASALSSQLSEPLSILRNTFTFSRTFQTSINVVEYDFAIVVESSATSIFASSSSSSPSIFYIISFLAIIAYLW